VDLLVPHREDLGSFLTVWLSSVGGLALRYANGVVRTGPRVLGTPEFAGAEAIPLIGVVNAGAASTPA
jgi:hypothetical protein